MSNKVAEHFAVIRAIDAASKKELRAIAGVEAAIRDSAIPATRPAASNYNPKRQRRAGATSDFNDTKQPDAAAAASHAVSSSEAASAGNPSPTVNNTTEQYTSSTSQAPVTQTSQAASPAVNVSVEPAPASSKEDMASIEQLKQAKETNALLEGLYQDSKGYWRQQSGAFATRQQKEAIAGKDKASEEKDGLTKRAMSWIKGALSEESNQNEAVDAAGVATAGSEWMAFKEVKNLSSKTMEYLKEQGLDSRKGIKDKAQKGWQKTVRAWNIARNPIKWYKGQLPNDTVAKQQTTKSPEPAPAQEQKPAEAPAADNKQSGKQLLLNVLTRGRFGMIKNGYDWVKQKRQQSAAKKAEQAKAQPAQSAQSVSEVDAAPGKPRKESLFRRLNPAPLLSHLGGKVFRKFTRSTGAQSNSQVIDNNTIDSVNRTGKNGALAARNADKSTEAITEAISEQTETLSAKFDRLEDAVKGVKAGAGGGGDSLLDNAMDLFGNRRGRNRRGRNRRGPKKPSRLGRFAGRIGSKLGSLVGMGVSTAATIGTGVAGAAGTAGATGTAAAAGASKFGLKGAAKMGGAVLSKLALPLTAAMAVYDGFKGFTDTEKQKETFKLKEGQEASLGQKTAMAAGSILSLGGLTDLIGFSGSDMASGIYKLFGGEIPEDAPEQAKSESKGGKVVESTGDINYETDFDTAQPTAEQKINQKVYGKSNVPSPEQLAGVNATSTASPVALTSFSTAPVQSVSRGEISPLMPVASDAVYAPAVPDPAGSVPPIPSDSQNASASESAPRINVVAQTDPKLLKAIEKMGGTGGNSEVVSKSKETIRHQSERVTQQIPTGLSDNTMRMIAMDLL